MNDAPSEDTLVSDENVFKPEREETPEEQFLTLANSLRGLIYGLFVLALVPLLLSCVGHWPVIFEAEPIVWLLTFGPSLTIILISLVGFFLTVERSSRRWYAVAILVAVTLPVTQVGGLCTGSCDFTATSSNGVNHAQLWTQ
jgi:hypothetical protein